MKTLTALLLALLTSASLVACGSEVIDARADGATASGSSAGAGTGGGGEAGCSGSACGEVVSHAMVSTGLMHACAVTATGAIKCWGNNLSGALGDGTTIDSVAPVEVIGFASGARAVAVSDAHTCAITSAGAVKCWGSNLSGSLGNDSTIDSLVPVEVVGLSSGVVALSAGASHTCALTGAGAVKCWGWNAQGQIGNGSTLDSAVPVDVVGLSSGVVSVSAGGNHTCAVTTTGAVRCWGDNHQGPLGNGSATDSPVPVDVVGLSTGVIAVDSGSEHTCAVTSTGALQCWGWNALGQLGNSSKANSVVPVHVNGLASGVVAVSAGVLHTCAVMAIGAVQCWGGNFIGQLGNGSTIDNPSPADVVGLSSGAGAAAVSTGSGHTCALIDDGAVRCWGPDFTIGTNAASFSSVPVEVMGL